MWLAQKRGAHRPHRTLPALLALALLLVTLPRVPGLAVSGRAMLLSGSGHNGGPGSWAPTGSMTTSESMSKSQSPLACWEAVNSALFFPVQPVSGGRVMCSTCRRESLAAI